MRWLRHSHAAIAALATLAVLALALLPAWQELRSRAFDVLSTWDAPLPDEPGVVLVAIDEPSFDALDEDWPWPRGYHAQLVTALREAGAVAVGFDVVFADPTDTEEDAALVAAVGPDTVLASSQQLVERDYGETLVETLPLPELSEAGAVTGLAGVTMDPDGVVRQLPYEGGLAWSLLQTAQGTDPAAAPDGALIQYFGGPNSYPTVSYYQALEPEAYLPPGFFDGQVVLVGLALQTAIASEEGGVDAFETPYTASSGLLTPGVEVQATVFDNLRVGLWIARAPEWVLALLALLGGLFGWLASRPKALWKRGLALAGLLALCVLGSWLAVRTGRTWIAPVDPMASALLSVLGIGVVDFAREQKQRKEIQGAFSRYVSPDMVDRLVADPSLLQLGGEKKELSVLFADIRGFTTISEALKDDPQGLVAVINDILDPLSEIVIAHGGTIDKYMGDCIMAFWNAPLDDPDHRANALKAGRAMVEALPGINAAIADRLPPGAEVKIGVGINSGTCVVGNMGSSKRFDYSILGDTVNAASRLEGQCKELGIPIVIGESTVEGSTEADLKRVTSLTLRGKSQAMDVYTLTDLEA
ncbi:adenylate/guanylate cyclase domain-containing protein [Paraurantiacibacter namhicola]|uniref:Adenylate cyclase 1 n=1 Tax=Paraurantiacibacter namhicola TaxID=645517 RepID=A0A1C7DBQ9_9SPHN|nr:adenylate/guanylate cyclase domain-containing protein [Paraurantiacibacter namhicola]ANU08713.1 Adenylate cyclase 1 [Paraurantiacibacter namhicola]